MDSITPKQEWTVAIRYNHWIMAFVIFILIVTGFYIAKPFTIYQGETINKFFMGNVRIVHVLFGMFLLFAFLWRAHLAFFSRFHADWKDFLAWTDVPNTIKQIKFYLLVSKEPPKHTHLYGPLQSVAYGGLFFMVLLILLTGLILTGAGYHAGMIKILAGLLKPLETILGGLAMVRLIHYILTWCFILFIIAHMYMAFWYDVIFKQGTISAMVSGLVYRKDH